MDLPTSKLIRPCRLVWRCSNKAVSLSFDRHWSGSLTGRFQTCRANGLLQWLPTDGSWHQSGLRKSGCGVANSSLHGLLKSPIFKTCLYQHCYISKTETRTGPCELHIISIIIHIWSFLYRFNWPDCRIESCAGRVILSNTWERRSHTFSRFALKWVGSCFKIVIFFDTLSHLFC